MTALAAPPIATGPITTVPVSRAWIPGVIVTLSVAYLTMPFAHAWGGREPWALTRLVVVVVAATIAAKPWRELRSGVLALAAAVAISALVIPLVTTPGWFGATRAAAYGLGAATFIAVAAYARSLRRAHALATIVAVAGAVQFAWSFIAWWGGRQPSAQMVATFYWHNPFAGFLLAPALIALSLVVANPAPWRLAGWVVTPLAVAGIVHSSSRGGLGVLLGGWLLIGVLAAVAKMDRRGSLIRWAAVSVLAVGVTFVISGPPFFSSSAAPLSAIQARSAAGETATANGEFRLYLWRESVTVFAHHPVAGVGYGGLAPAAATLTPASWPRSPLSHNYYLQALVEGGLILGVPFLGACALIGVGLLRVFRGRVRRRVVDVRTGLAVAALALMAHAAIDFDWTYPALFVLAATVAALAVAPIMRRPVSGARLRVESSPERGGILVRAVLVGVLLVTVVAGGIASRTGGVRLGFHGTDKAAADPAISGTSATSGTAGK